MLPKIPKRAGRPATDDEEDDYDDDPDFSSAKWSDERIAERAAKARADGKLAAFEAGLLAAYEAKKTAGRKIVAFLGMGRAGKDTAAEYLCFKAGLTYAGSSSKFALPFVAHMQGIDESRAWNRRHSCRGFWIRACHALRKDDPTWLLRLALGGGDVAVGIRGLYELKESVSCGVVDLTVWVSNGRVPNDPTVEYGREDCDLVIENEGSRTEFFRKLDRLAHALYGVK